MQQELSKWDKMRLRLQKIADGRVAVMTLTVVIDRKGELECWTEPRCNRLEGAPASLGMLVNALKNGGE